MRTSSLSFQRLASVILIAWTTSAMVYGFAACSRAPAEPEARPGASVSQPAVEPLRWTVPAAWSASTGPSATPRGASKAVLKVPHVGADKEDAEVTILFFGTGNQGDPQKVFQDWFAQFDGNPSKNAKRETMRAGAFEADTVEFSGTYKINLTPPGGPKKMAPVQMVKENWSFVGAVVKTPERGNWFFKLIGPKETVASATAAFHALLESVK